MESMKKIAILIFISTLLFATSCRTKKAAIGTTAAYKSSKLFKKIKKSNIDYKWYSYKSDATAYFDGTTVGGTVDIRIKRGEVIWMSVKKFGFEVARVLIRPDSAFAIDRFNGRYMADSYGYFTKKYNIPVKFEVLQDLLVANNITQGQKPVNGSVKGEKYTLKTQGKDLGIVYELDKDFKVSNSIFKSKDNKTIEIKLANYKSKFGKEIPYLRKYSFPNSISPKYFLNLKIKDIKINKAQKIKFEIPKKYTKM